MTSPTDGLTLVDTVFSFTFIVLLMVGSGWVLFRALWSARKDNKIYPTQKPDYFDLQDVAMNWYKKNYHLQERIKELEKEVRELKDRKKL